MPLNYRSVSILLGFLSLGSIAQETIGGLPSSMLRGYDSDQVPIIDTDAFSEHMVHSDDLRREEEGLLPLYARFIRLEIDPTHHGTWTELPNGDGLWRLGIRSAGALALELFCQDYDLPEGATLYLYDAESEQIHGGYTAYNRQPDGSFSSDMIHGDLLYIEYNEPAAFRGEGFFRISDVAHAYRMVGWEMAEGGSDPCEVDVNCSEGVGWEAQRDAVVRIRVVVPEGLGYCTGTLVNNTAQDCKGYILSALHCSLGSTTAQFNQYQFRFRYQRSGCTTGSVPTGNTLTGCVRRADSNDNGGNSGSDFVLLELNNPIPASYQPYYAGWNAGTSASPNGKCIHHPAGDLKSISTYTNALVTGGWGIVGSHWRVTWTATANGHGVTEGGSSGSPLFDPNKRIVGTLTGGGSCCTANGCGPGTGPNVSDYYGKMSHHWTQNPNTTSQKLKAWLDPLNTGALVLDGSHDPCATIGIYESETMSAPLILPNPATSAVVIRYPPGVDRVERVEVTDLRGRVVHSDGTLSPGGYELDVSGWATGPYLVRLVNGSKAIPSTKLFVMP